MKIKTIVACGLTVLMLAACGESRSDRAISGGGLGAAAGAGVAAITGGNALTGAAIGAGAGALGGALTDKSDVNLGKPVWR